MVASAGIHCAAPAAAPYEHPDNCAQFRLPLYNKPNVQKPEGSGPKPGRVPPKPRRVGTTDVRNATSSDKLLRWGYRVLEEEYPRGVKPETPPATDVDYGTSDSDSEYSSMALRSMAAAPGALSTTPSNAPTP